jgi:hypothetical protein
VRAEEFSTLRVHACWLTCTNNSLINRVPVFASTKSEEDSMKWKMNAPSCFGLLTALLLTCGAAAQTRNLEAIATLKF